MNLENDGDRELTPNMLVQDHVQEDEIASLIGIPDVHYGRSKGQVEVGILNDHQRSGTVYQKIDMHIGPLRVMEIF